MSGEECWLTVSVSEQKVLKSCGLHPSLVFWDGPNDACPACAAEREWLLLSQEMKARRAQVLANSREAAREFLELTAGMR